MNTKINTVYAVVGSVDRMDAIVVVETDESRAVDGLVYGTVESFFSSKPEAEARMRTLRKAQDNVWK